jgi:hypothetical protein
VFERAKTIHVLDCTATVICALRDSSMFYYLQSDGLGKTGTNPGSLSQITRLVGSIKKNHNFTPNTDANTENIDLERNHYILHYIISYYPVWKTENKAVGIRHADHVAPSIRKSRH